MLDPLEDGKSVSGRSGFDHWSLCVKHCRNGVVVLCKKVAEGLSELKAYEFYLLDEIERDVRIN